MNLNRLVPSSSKSSTYAQASHEARCQINQMSTDLLNKLNNSSSEVTRFIQRLPTMQSIENTHQQLIETFAELTSLHEKYLEQIETGKYENVPSSNLILAKLQSKFHESERINDEMIETFCHTYHNDHDVERFIKSFLHD